MSTPLPDSAGNTSSFQLSRHPYAENSFILNHFTGKLLVSREDLEEAYLQLDAFLHPNPGYQPRIVESADDTFPPRTAENPEHVTGWKVSRVAADTHGEDWVLQLSNGEHFAIHKNAILGDIRG